MKRQPSEWGKIIANEATDKGLISKSSSSSTQYQQNKQLNKWEKDLNRHFSKEDIQMINKHVKRFSTLLIINPIIYSLRNRDIHEALKKCLSKKPGFLR